MTIKEILSKIVDVFFSRIFEIMVAIFLYMFLIGLQFHYACEKKEIKEPEAPPAATREYKV